MGNSMNRIFDFALIAVAVSLGAATAAAQTILAWPTKPIKAFIPFGAGSATDVVPRAVFDLLAMELGQPIVIENRGGAGGTLGVGAVVPGRARRLHHPCQFLGPHHRALDRAECPL
jgi:tripartite-type tricarboxylate transporter receptor subunit TctC